MVLNFHPRLLIILALLVVAHCSSTPSASNKIGGCVRVSPTDPHVIEIAKFAVHQRNQVADSNLAFETVLEACTQLVAGTNYVMILTAKHGKGESNYSALVYVNLSGQKCLEEFKRLLG